jgi:hypothetical protein
MAGRWIERYKWQRVRGRTARIRSGPAPAVVGLIRAAVEVAADAVRSAMAVSNEKVESELRRPECGLQPLIHCHDVTGVVWQFFGQLAI